MTTKQAAAHTAFLVTIKETIIHQLFKSASYHKNSIWSPTLLPLRMWYHTDVPPKSMWKSV